MSDDDKELVRAARQGDFTAFEQLVRRHQARIYAVCLGMLKSTAEAEEATQETFLSAFKKLDTFREDAAFFTWLYRVAANHCLMRLRKRKPEAIGGLSELEDAIARQAEHRRLAPRPRRPDEIALSSELRSALAAALDRLDDETRAILLLRAFDGLPNQEIADLFSLSVGAVKSRLHRARLAVRAEIAELLPRRSP